VPTLASTSITVRGSGPQGIAFTKGIEEIRAIKVDPAYMNEARWTNLAATNLNTVRLQPEMADWIADDTSGRAAMVTTWQGYVQDALDEGFRVHFQFGIQFADRLSTQSDDDGWADYKAGAVTFATMLSGFSPQEVMIDLFNEPRIDSVVSGDGGSFTWAERSADLYAAVRVRPQT
jgi:hypothetical protein